MAGLCSGGVTDVTRRTEARAIHRLTSASTLTPAANAAAARCAPSGTTHR